MRRAVCITINLTQGWVAANHVREPRALVMGTLPITPTCALMLFGRFTPWSWLLTAFSDVTERARTGATSNGAGQSAASAPLRWFEEVVRITSLGLEAKGCWVAGCWVLALLVVGGSGNQGGG